MIYCNVGRFVVMCVFVSVRVCCVCFICLGASVLGGVVWFACLYYCLRLCGCCLMCVWFVCGLLCDVVGVCCCAVMFVFVVLRVLVCCLC